MYVKEFRRSVIFMISLISDVTQRSYMRETMFGNNISRNLRVRSAAGALFLIRDQLGHGWIPPVPPPPLPRSPRIALVRSAGSAWRRGVHRNGTSGLHIPRTARPRLLPAFVLRRQRQRLAEDDTVFIATTRSRLSNGIKKGRHESARKAARGDFTWSTIHEPSSTKAQNWAFPFFSQDVELRRMREAVEEKEKEGRQRGQAKPSCPSDAVKCLRHIKVTPVAPISLHGRAPKLVTTVKCKMRAAAREVFGKMRRPLSLPLPPPSSIRTRLPPAPTPRARVMSKPLRRVTGRRFGCRYGMQIASHFIHSGTGKDEDERERGPTTDRALYLYAGGRMSGRESAAAIEEEESQAPNSWTSSRRAYRTEHDLNNSTKSCAHPIVGVPKESILCNSAKHTVAQDKHEMDP